MSLCFIAFTGIWRMPVTEEMRSIFEVCLAGFRRFLWEPFLRGEQLCIKVKKSAWNKIADVFHRALVRDHLVDKYEKEISGYKKRETMLNDQLEKLKRFVASQELEEAFAEFVKSIATKPFGQRLKEAKVEAAEQDRQKNIDERRLPTQNKHC